MMMKPEQMVSLSCCSMLNSHSTAVPRSSQFGTKIRAEVWTFAHVINRFMEHSILTRSGDIFVTVYNFASTRMLFCTRAYVHEKNKR